MGFDTIEINLVLFCIPQYHLFQWLVAGAVGGPGDPVIPEQERNKGQENATTPNLFMGVQTARDQTVRNLAVWVRERHNFQKVGITKSFNSCGGGSSK